MSGTDGLINVCSTDDGVELAHSIVFPDSKLQTLDRRVGAEQLYFGKEYFQQSVSDWEGIPLIYNKTGMHPLDFKAVSENPDKAAKDIGGKLVGTVRNPRIVLEGGARLMATLEINQDEAELYQLWQEGKLFPSTAFMVHSDGDKITSPPVPNHVLLLPQVKDRITAGDFGAYVNSVVTNEPKEKPMETNTNACGEKTTKKQKKSFSEWIRGIAKEVFAEESKKVHSETVVEVEKPEEPPKPEVNPEPEIPKQEQNMPTEEPKTEIKEIVEDVRPNPEATEKDALINSLTEELNALKAEIQKQKETEQELKFSKFLDEFVPVGMKATKEQVDTIRAQYNSDVVSLMFSIRAEKEKAGTGETSRVGEPYAVTNSNLKAYESVGDLCFGK